MAKKFTFSDNLSSHRRSRSDVTPIDHIIGYCTKQCCWNHLELCSCKLFLKCNRWEVLAAPREHRELVFQGREGTSFQLWVAASSLHQLELLHVLCPKRKVCVLDGLWLTFNKVAEVASLHFCGNSNQTAGESNNELGFVKSPLKHHHPPFNRGDVGQGQFLFRLLRALKWWETLGGNDAKPCVKCELQRIS